MRIWQPVRNYHPGARMSAFVRFVVKRFIEDDCAYRASALAFTTLLAIVPLMSVGVSILSSLPVFRQLATPLQDFIFDNFVPASGKVVQGYLEQFASQVAELSVTGVCTLLVSALLVMYTIETSMNRIWRVSSPRKGPAAFLLYWAILSLSPLLLGLSLAASSWMISQPFIQHSTPTLFIGSLPLFLSFAGFSFLYIVVPNCPVHLRHGLIAGAIAAILFESAKHVFAGYLARYNSYELLYGAFAAIPVFFVWVYWVWVITLVGAEISYALSVHHLRRTGQSLDGFSHALLWLWMLWKAQCEGKTLSREALINGHRQPFEVDADGMLNTLVSLHLVEVTQDGQYVFNRDPSQISLYHLTQLLPWRLPNAGRLGASTSPWNALLREMDKTLFQALDVSLEALFVRERAHTKA